MNRIAPNPAWVEAEFEDTLRDVKTKKPLPDINPIARYANLKDAMARENPVPKFIQQESNES